jgi:hypothetical protein
LSGVIRRYAYTFSEALLAHWLLLVGADRVDVIENPVKALFEGNPDDVIKESGIASELKRHGWKSRVGKGRADIKHQPLDLAFTSLGALFSLPSALVRQRRKSAVDPTAENASPTQ